MIKLNTINWKILLEADTPPCISVILNNHGNTSQYFLYSQLKRTEKKAKKLLQKTYNRQVQSRMLELLRMQYQKISFSKDHQSTLLFVSPDISAFSHLDHEYDENVVVANSFHITPLIEACWNQRSTGIYIHQNGNVDVMCPTDSTPQFTYLSALDSCRDLEEIIYDLNYDYLGGYNLYDSTLFKAIDSHRKVQVIESHSLEAFHQKLSELDQSRTVRSIRVHEEIFETISKENSPDVSESLQKLKENRAKLIFAPIRTKKWGRFDNDGFRYKLNNQLKQQNGLDDCIVDDVIESGVRKNLKIHLVCPSKWSLDAPFWVL